ncbi:TetR/AcrR family transcriptional regulator [Halopseudomonas pelagia]|uniref:TetR/AcrR family transcriptional regulator n=1 Tax=Halopseudomonas pelagia TaxID=553151 RepID=UPI0030D7E071|tara:strand:- start:1135 stop:1743 length:609 start_codon:yes stop_codon:yes gene_type:complete
MSLTPVQKRIHLAAMELFASRKAMEVNVSELAEIAGVARGTIYNNLTSIDTLFEDVASNLNDEMNQRIAKSFEVTTDAAQRLANGIRFYVRRAHEEPIWARFIVKYGPSNAALLKLWSGPPAQDLLMGLTQSRYRFPAEQLPAVLAMVTGSVVMTIQLVLNGHRTWREAGADTAELILRAIGVPQEDATRYVQADLPDLPML